LLSSRIQDLFDRMLQKLLVDRFQIKYHWGEQTQDGYVLLADNPKMKKADPKMDWRKGWSKVRLTA
jgi:uncharacterized protein (TIGR03435 family)